MPQLICACTSLTWYIPFFELDDSLVAFAHLVTDDRFELRESAAEPFECTFIRKCNAHHLGIDVMNQPLDQKLQADTSIRRLNQVSQGQKAVRQTEQHNNEKRFSYINSALEPDMHIVCEVKLVL